MSLLLFVKESEVGILRQLTAEIAQQLRLAFRNTATIK